MEEHERQGRHPHERRGQQTHRDILVTAREGGSDHAGLTRWWGPLHHVIGKAG